MTTFIKKAQEAWLACDTRDKLFICGIVWNSYALYATGNPLRGWVVAILVALLVPRRSVFVAEFSCDCPVQTKPNP